MRRRHPAWYREDVGRLFSMLASGELRPRVFDRVPLERAADALARIARGEVKGKVVVELDDDIPSGEPGPAGGPSE